MSDELKGSSLEFGTIIAFVAPGFLALKAAAYHLPTAHNWMQAASDKDQNVGVFLFALLASLSLGLAVSGVRALLIDGLLSWEMLGPLKLPKLTIDWKALDEKGLAKLVALRDNYYRFYQFYSNTMVALAVWIVARSTSDMPPLAGQSWVALVAILVVLLLAARQQLNLYYAAVNALGAA